MRPLIWTATLAFLCSAALAQQPASQAEVRLEARNNQTTFKLGDIIPLRLVFRDPAFPDVRSTLQPNKPWMPLPGQRTVNTTDYGDLADDVTITPATGWFKWQGRSGHDYSNSTPLDATGIRVAVILNQGYVFREPGHYEITITTRRAGYEQPMTTNPLGIDIAPRSADEEAALVRSLDSTIANSKGKQRNRAALQLSYLPGDDAARTKIRWLLSEEDDVSSIMTGGMAATRNQKLQVQLLRDAWLDPAHAPDFTLQGALRAAEMFERGQMQLGWVMTSAGPRNDENSRALAEEYHDDLERLIATLPKRTGDNRRDTAYFLMEANELSPEQLGKVKPVALAEFPRMDAIQQSMLIETRWKVMQDPSLAPSLKVMVDDSKSEFMDSATAVERLIEIDERDARPYVIEMVCRAKRGLLLDKLNGVHEDRIPEVDACLKDILSQGERSPHDFDWEQAAQRAARFATPAILPAIKAVWTSPTQDASMLALLIRDAPDEAVSLLNREPDVDWYPAGVVYQALNSTWPPQILAWLRSDKAPARSVYELSQHGEPQDRLLLEHRLDDLRNKWRGRESELQKPQPNTPAALAGNQESELISSLFSAHAWTLTDEEKTRLTTNCFTDWCRLYQPHHPAK